MTTNIMSQALAYARANALTGIRGVSIGDGCHKAVFQFNVISDAGEMQADPIRLSHIDISMFTDDFHDFDDIRNVFNNGYSDFKPDMSNAKKGDVFLAALSIHEPIVRVDPTANNYVVLKISSPMLVNDKGCLLEALDCFNERSKRLSDVRLLDFNIIVKNTVVGKAQYGQYVDPESIIDDSLFAFIISMGARGQYTHLDEQRLLRQSIFYIKDQVCLDSARFDHGRHNHLFVNKQSLAPIQLIGKHPLTRKLDFNLVEKLQFKFCNRVLSLMNKDSARWFSNNDHQLSVDPDYIRHQSNFVDCLRAAFRAEFGKDYVSVDQGVSGVVYRGAFETLNKNAFQKFNYVYNEYGAANESACDF